MIGIYKITSPSNKIYIGQSKNVEKRIKFYKYTLAKGQPRLYNSFKKYGYENHTFEIIHCCEIHELFYFERYYQDLFSVELEKGLNCMINNGIIKPYDTNKELIKRQNIINIIDSII
jgi:group I intron endonuclease